MKGLEVSEVKLKDVLFENESYRVDSEYFLKINLKNLQQLEKNGYYELGEMAYITDGIHASIDYDDTSPVKLLSATSPRENVFDFSRKVFISEKAHRENPRTALREGDIILSTVGTIGNCAVVDSSILPANSDRHVGIIRMNNGVPPHFISTFFLSKYGRFQTKRETTGNVQPNLFLSKIRQFKIADFSTDFQQNIADYVQKEVDKLTNSQSLYRQAEADLLHHLGLPAQPPRPVLHEVVANVKTLHQDTVSVSRWDAEFYETRHDSLANKLTAQPYLSLGSVCCAPISRGVQPEFVEGGEVYVVASKAVRPYGLDLRPDETTSAEFFHSSKATKGRIEQYDVLLNGTGRGTLGRAGIYTASTPALADNHVTILRLYPGRLNPFYLMLFLNSWPGQLQSEQWQCGSSGQTELYPNQIEQFIIPDLPPAQQAAIAERVQRSFALRNESEALLTRAKQAVEVAIERGEAAGLALLSPP